MDRKSKKQKRLSVIPALENSSLIPILPAIPAIPAIPIRSSSMRPPSRKDTILRLGKYPVLPDIGNGVNSVIRGNDTEDSLSSVPGFPVSAELSQYEKTREAATFMSATDRARLFGINKWY